MPNTSKSKQSYPEIDDIREDLDSLRSNVVELTKHLKKDGSAQTKVFKGILNERLDQIQTSGRTQYKNVEKHIKAKPGKSIAIAFAAGLAASMLMRRR